MTDEPTDLLSENGYEEAMSTISYDEAATDERVEANVALRADRKALRAALARSEAELDAAKETVRWMSEETLADRARKAALREALIQAKAYLDLCVMVGDHQSIDDPKALVDSALAAFDMQLAPNLNDLIEQAHAALDSTDDTAEAIMAALRAAEAVAAHVSASAFPEVAVLRAALRELGILPKGES